MQMTVTSSAIYPASLMIHKTAVTLEMTSTNQQAWEEGIPNLIS